MDYKQILEVVGKVAGIAGLGIGAMLLIFREVIRRNIFPKLEKDHAYKIIRLIVILVWSIAVLGIFAWVYSGSPTSNGISKVPGNLEAVQNLDSLNHTIYLELKDERVDKTKDTYQNLQLILLGDSSKRASYTSGVKRLRANNDAITKYLLEIISEIKTPTFKVKAEQFIQHAGMVDTRYESAMQSNINSNLPDITVSYPDDFKTALKEEIKAWKN